MERRSLANTSIMSMGAIGLVIATEPTAMLSDAIGWRNVFLVLSALVALSVVFDVLAATEGVMACFEIVDSRIENWQIKIQDTVADNASCGVFVLGDQLVDIRDLDLSLCGMAMEKNGDVVVTGAGAATMASPINAVVWLANTLGSLGISLKAGDIVLSGALGAMVPVAAGDNLRIAIGDIGGCSVRFV